MSSALDSSTGIRAALRASVALSLMLGAYVLAGCWIGGSVLADDGDGIGPGLRLVMVDDAGCVYCRKWDAEVGGIYQRSPVGVVAPLVRRPKRHRDLAPYEPLAYTPTFILVRDGAEIGRIVGYPGVDFFWAELERLIAKAGPLPPDRQPAAPAMAKDALLVWPGGGPRLGTPDGAPLAASPRAAA